MSAPDRQRTTGLGRGGFTRHSSDRRRDRHRIGTAAARTRSGSFQGPLRPLCTPGNRYGLFRRVRNSSRTVLPTVDAALERVLNRSETLVLVVTTVAMQSPWVEYEWSRFLSHKRLIIPLCLEGPGPTQLPNVLQRYHVLDCRASGIERLHVEALNRLITGAMRHRENDVPEQ